MKITLESPEALSDEELEKIVNVWTRKPTRIAVRQSNHLHVFNLDFN